MQITDLLQKVEAGDAAAASRLAAELKIDIVWYPQDVWAHNGPHDATVYFSAHAGDPLAAMTKGILDVAKAMLKQGT